MTLLASATTPAVLAAEILRVLQTEERLAADNRLAPYADILAPALARCPPLQLAGALDLLSGPEACRALFGGFRTLPHGATVELFHVAGSSLIGRLVDEMALGPDLPARAARALAALAPSEAASALLAASVLAATRVASLLPPERLAPTVLTIGADAPDWLERALAVASPAEAIGLTDAALRRERAVLWHTAPGAVARALTSLASRQPRRAGALLGALADLILVRAADGALRRALYRPRGAAVLGWLDPGDPAVADLLAHVDAGVLAALVARADPEARLRLAPLVGGRGSGPVPDAYPPVRAAGVRRSERADRALRVVHLTETVVVGGRAQPLRVDLVEVDLSGVRLRACGASSTDRSLAFAEIGDIVGQVRRGSPSPGDAFFRQLGIVRLRDAVAAHDAVVGINGGFYLDYGHYLDAIDLGIDLVAQPALRLGSVIGWFVTEGRAVSPAAFNRAALVVTADQRAHIRRVRPTQVALSNGRVVPWRAGPGAPNDDFVCFDPLAASTTPVTPARVDVSVSGTTVTGIRHGGGSPVPLLGFVLSVPQTDAESLLRGVAVGDQVVIGNDFPPALGPVEEAMACGPLLVRDGQVDLDFDEEGFGEKDSTVLPISLTRAAGSFRAARSFVMLRAGTLVLGVVSGTVLGGGPPTASVGTTFGELAQLCVDLGAEDSMAFDGGGASSLIARVGGQPRLLNVPTGGADVPVGVERFIKTYWLGLTRDDTAS